MLRVACGVKKSTRLFFGVPSMLQRRVELATRWGNGVENFNGDFLVYHAMTYRKHNEVIKKSCFGHCKKVDNCNYWNQ